MFETFQIKQTIERPPSKVDHTIYNIFPTFEPSKGLANFQLYQMTTNKKLMSNIKFARLINNIQQYNINLSKFGEQNIIKYKLYEFLYTSLRICNTKTHSEIDDYLDLVDNWFNKYNTKRGLAIIQKKVKVAGKEEQIIRQTFKSNLPLQINQYKRRVLNQDAVKGDESSADTSLNGIDELMLPSFRSYQIELMNIRRKRQEKEEAVLKQQIKKSYSRIQSLTSNNFYKAVKNKNDVLREKASTEKFGKQNLHMFRTKEGFFQIKKNRFNETIEKKRFLRQTNIDKEEDFQTKQIPNIDGLFLLKNPFEAPKKQKMKKKK